jgi:hypothetical protein
VPKNIIRERIFAHYSSTSLGSIASGVDTVLNFGTLVEDSHNAVTIGAGWIFTAPRTDDYVITSGFRWNSITNMTLTNLYMIAGGVIKLLFTSDVSWRPHGTTTVHINAGQTIQMLCGQTDSGAAARATYSSGGQSHNYIVITSP